MSRFTKKLVTVLLILVVASWAFVTFFLEDIITKTLNDKIEVTFGSYYQLEYESEKIRLTGMRIDFDFEKVKFSTDTLLNSPVEHYPILFFEAESFKVQGISIINLLLNKSITVDLLELDYLELLLLKKENAEQGDQQVKTITSTSKKDKNSLSHISLNALNILNAGGAILPFENQKDTLYSAKALTIKLEGLQTDLSSNIIDPESIELKNFNMELDQIFLNPIFSPYKFLVDKSHLDLKNGELMSFGIKAFPKKSFYETSVENEFRKTIFNIQIDSLLCKSEDLMEMFTNKLLKTKNIELINVQAYVYENNNIEKEETILKPLINESILNIPFNLDIDSVLIKNGFIEYQFLSKNGNEPARIDFSELNGHIANIRKTSEKADTVKIFLESNFMKQAPFTFIAEYPLSDINYQSYSGHIGSLPFSSFEPVFRGPNEIKFKTGQVNNIFFTGTADNLKTSGQLIFDYQDLNIQLLSKKHKKQWLKSSIVNLVVRNDGEDGTDKKADHVNFSYIRPKTVGQFGLYARGIMDGLAQVILPPSIYKKSKK